MHACTSTSNLLAFSPSSQGSKVLAKNIANSWLAWALKRYPVLELPFCTAEGWDKTCWVILLSWDMFDNHAGH